MNMQPIAFLKKMDPRVSFPLLITFLTNAVGPLAIKK